jgi:hypothetical protein
MMLRRLLIVLVFAALTTSSARAGIFSRKPKVNPTERVPELLSELKTSNDEGERTSAAEELRQFDPKSHPEIMTGLIGALNKDGSPTVRAEAAASLGKLRPISQQAGYALEQAQNNDGSLRVRMAARQALFQYHIVGYRGGKPDSSPDKDATQPVSAPTANSALVGMVKSPPPAVRIIMTPQGQFRETEEPPLADPTVAPKAVAATPVARPKIAAPAKLIPTDAPKLKPIPDDKSKTDGAYWKPAQPAGNDGPTLPPPQ